MATLGGLGLGSALGLLIGALIGSGCPKYEVKKYEAGHVSGNILMSVHTNTDQEKTKAKEIMEKAGAKDISCVCEKTKKNY